MNSFFRKRIHKRKANVPTSEKRLKTTDPPLCYNGYYGSPALYPKRPPLITFAPLF
jgi:hypothetical protein